MKSSYLKIPTHKKLGWLLFLVGFVVMGSIGMGFEDGLLKNLVIGGLQVLFLVAFIVEVGAALLGKNKKIEELPKNEAPKTSNLDNLEKLADLKRKGVITEEEFNQKKKQILG